MNSREYWKERFEQLEQSQNRKGLQCYADIENQYRQAQKQIEGQLTAWYGRFASNNGITIQEARKMLTSKELEEFKWDIQDYIRYGEENAINGNWTRQLENASARYHISRLEALKMQTQQSLEVMFGNQLDSIDSAMREIYTSGYYHTAFEIQKGVGVGWDFATLDDKTISKVINKPWATDGKNFSERIWGNRQKLVNELNSTLAQNIILGKDPQKAIDAITQKMNTSKTNAGKLVMTEEAFFSSAAQKDCFTEFDVEQFENIATLDSHTSDICQEMDGKHFPMSQWEVGVTAPPFHVWCRTTTAPYFDDEFDVGERAARGEDGKIYYVPADMNYKEWKKSFVDGGSKDDLTSVVSDGTMTDIDKKAILDYMSAKSYILNEKLRTGTVLSNDEEKFVVNLDMALKKMPVYEGNLQRSLFFYSDDDVTVFLKEHKKGNIVKYNEFVSTTKGELYNPDGQVQIYIQNAKKGRDISSLNEGENEVLYERNTSFKIINTIEHDGKYYILMEETDAE